MIYENILIAELSPEALHRLADHYLSMSQKLRAAAKRKAAALSRESASRAHVEKLQTIPGLVRQYMAGGMTQDAAVYAASCCTGAPVETVRAWLKREHKERDAAALVKRNRDIADALGRRQSTRNVAAAFGLSQTRVRQIAERQRVVAEAMDMNVAAFAAHVDRVPQLLPREARRRAIAVDG